MSKLDRTQAPPFQLSSDYSLPLPEVLSHGSIDIFAFRELSLDVVKVELIFASGKWHEPAIGISHFTSQMLNKGTRSKNSFEIAESLDSLGAHLEISPGFDVVAISLFALRKKLMPAMTILSEILSESTFDEEELRIMKEIFIQNLKVNREKTNVVASKEIRKSIFGSSHPYGSSIEEEDVEKLTSNTLKKFFEEDFALKAVFIVGRLSDSEVQEVMTLVGSKSKKESRPERIAISKGASLAISKPGSIQASIRLGKQCGPRTNSTDHFESVMFNHVLGGYFGSRLMKNIREEKGLTYGIYSSLNHFLHHDFWMIGAEVNLQNGDQALQEIRNEISALQNQRVPHDELEAAKNYFIGSWQSENSTLFAVAEKYKGLYLWGLPNNFYMEMLSYIQELRPTQIQSIANKYFDASDLIEVRVG
ncbi:MAG: insulinase family protein [Cyclobacteriaceae bacterium]|nr:insulinase family protein [Cyclobacteriaceae bacterium]